MFPSEFCLSSSTANIPSCLPADHSRCRPPVPWMFPSKLRLNTAGSRQCRGRTGAAVLSVPAPAPAKHRNNINTARQTQYSQYSQSNEGKKYSRNSPDPHSDLGCEERSESANWFVFLWSQQQLGWGPPPHQPGEKFETQ